MWGKRKGLQFLFLAHLRKLESLYTKWSCFHFHMLYPGWKKLLFLFTVMYLMTGQVCKRWCQYSLRASSECCCKELAAGMLHLAPSPSLLLQLELCHLFQTIFKKPNNTIVCADAWSFFKAAWCHDFKAMVRQFSSLSLHCVHFLSILLDWLPLGSTADISDGE